MFLSRLICFWRYCISCASKCFQNKYFPSYLKPEGEESKPTWKLILPQGVPKHLNFSIGCLLGSFAYAYPEVSFDDFSDVALSRFWCRSTSPYFAFDCVEFDILLMRINGRFWEVRIGTPHSRGNRDLLSLFDCLLTWQIIEYISTRTPSKYSRQNYSFSNIYDRMSKGVYFSVEIRATCTKTFRQRTKKCFPTLRLFLW